MQVCGAAVELATSTLAFWKQTGKVYQAEHPRDPNSRTGRTREALRNKLTWVFALFIFGYVGAEGTFLSFTFLQHIILPTIQF